MNLPLETTRTLCMIHKVAWTEATTVMGEQNKMMLVLCTGVDKGPLAISHLWDMAWNMVNCIPQQEMECMVGF